MRREVEIVNKLGLHARPPALFVRWVSGSRALSRFGKARRSSRAASLLEVLTANLDCGARVVLEAIGSDELEAINEPVGASSSSSG
jgi:phosphocarrier protein HPr